jgi:AraC-like DNA-binding protein
MPTNSPPLDWYEEDQRYLAAHQWPSALIDLLLSRGIDEHRLLNKTGLFLDSIHSGKTRVSTQQLLQLTANSQYLFRGNDLAFLWGNRLWPGNNGAFSTLLMNASDLGDAIDQLQIYRSMLSPLLVARRYDYQQHLVIHWLDVAGCGEQRDFLAIVMMTALASFSRWMSGNNLPWQFYLQQKKPAGAEQFDVHWNGSVHFDCQMNMMTLPLHYVQQLWPNSSTTGRIMAQRECEQFMADKPRSTLLDALYCWLLNEIRQPISLERTAAAFAMSPATLKRKLQKHGTSFQQLCDEVRKHVALYLFAVKGFNNDEVAAYLGYHDATNLRRSFRRWTGLTPSGLRELAASVTLV